MSDFKNIYDTPEEIEVKFVATSTALHRLEYGRMFTDYQIWSGEGKTGTQLGEGTDFAVGGKSNDASAIKAEDVYTGFQILNSAYHDVVLYATITFVASLGNADTIKPPTQQYGDDIQSTDTLMLDGVNPATNEGVQPLTNTAKFIPPVLDIDGQESANNRLAYPGRRGMWQVTEELENLIVNGNDADSWTATGSAIKTQAGEWVQISTTAGSEYLNQAISITSANGLFSAILQWDDDTITAASFGTNAGQGSINVSTQDVTFSGGTILEEQWLDSKTLRLTLSDSSISPTLFLFYPDTTGAAVGRIKNAMAIDFGSDTPYPVEYFEGVLPAGDIEYPVSLGNGSTFETKFSSGSDRGNQNIFFIHNGTSQLGCFVRSSGVLSVAGSAITQKDGTTVVNDDVMRDIKMVLNSDFTIEVYLDGVLEIDGVVSTITDWADYTLLGIGSNGSYSASDTQLNGLISEVLYRPSIDTSTTHYDLGEPYRDPDAIYDERGYKTDKLGNEGKKSIRTALPMPGEWELVWEGSAPTPDIVLSVGTYMIDTYFTSAATDHMTSIINFVGINAYGPSFTYPLTTSNRLATFIASTGLVSCVNAGAYTGHIARIYKQVGS